MSSDPIMERPDPALDPSGAAAAGPSAGTAATPIAQPSDPSPTAEDSKGEQPVISLQNVNHWFGSGDSRKHALKDITLDIYPGQIVICTGPSGSGKTTLLTMLGGLRSCQDGSLKILGQELNGASKEQLADLRLNVGFIFQAHNLMMFLNARRNVRLSLELHDRFYDQNMDQLATAMLEKVGLGDRVEYMPANLSGGQRQRVAIARALVSQPKILLGDEPTAALDKESGRTVVELMQQLAREQNTTIIMVTHDNKILDVADRIIIVEDGRLATAEQQAAFVQRMRDPAH
jgi:putative ABC transport system ATP-binding protein